MKKLILPIISLLVASCNSNNNTDATKEVMPAIKATDTREKNPVDTTHNYDTGSYQKMSDSLRQR